MFNQYMLMSNDTNTYLYLVAQVSGCHLIELDKREKNEFHVIVYM